MGRRKSKFTIDEDGFINVYVDGCCINPDGEISATGYGIYFGPNHRLKVFGPCKRKATNHQAEIQGAYLAIGFARNLGVTKLCINTDSQVVYDAATGLIAQWKSNGWHSIFDGSPIKDRVYFEKLDLALNYYNPHMEFKFNLLRGHSGNENHNEADHLARKGATRHCNYHLLNSK